MKYHITIENDRTKTAAKNCMTFSTRELAQKYVDQFNESGNHITAKVEKRGGKMKNLLVIAILAVLFTVATEAPSYGAVDGITADNYTTWEKTYADEPGYNKGECDFPYLDGEEYFYNEYVDHWNVDRVYDASLIPADWGKTTTAKATTAKATPKAKKANKAKKAKKSKKSKTGKKSKKAKK